MRGGLWACFGITAGLLLVFYVGVWLLPGAIRGVAAQSIYNYRETVEQALARGDHDEAVAVLEHAARRVPRDIYFERPEFILDWIGRIRKEQGRAPESLAAFLRAQERYFRNIQLEGYLPPPRLVDEIIDAYFETGNRAGAYNEARAAMDFYPMLADRFLAAHRSRSANDPQIMRDLGLLEIKMGWLPAGRNSLRQSLARQPYPADSHFWLGFLHEQQGSLASAIDEYEAELANSPCAENALAQLIRLYDQTDRDKAHLARQRRAMHSKAIAQYISDDPSKPLASLWGVASKSQRTFDLSKPGRLLVNIRAHSTPCRSVYGWFEVSLDGKHVQTVYADHREPRTHTVRLDGVEAGRHELLIENLSDARTEKEDRNVFIDEIRIYYLANE